MISIFETPKIDINQHYFIICLFQDQIYQCLALLFVKIYTFN